MPICNPVEPITEDDETVRRMLSDAELPPLLPALAQITGDMSLVADDDLRPPPREKHALIAPQGGMSPEAQERARERAFEALRRFRDGGCQVAAEPRPDDMRRLMHFLTGEVSEAYEPLLMQELGLAPDAGRPGWSKQAVAPDVDFSVVVIGGGMSGLAAAHRLDQAGVPFVVLERNDDVGGVWLENRYPGCRLDTNNFAYSYSFAQKDDWRQQYSRQDAIQGYFRDVADEFGLRDRIRFGREAVAATFDDDACTWTVVARDRDGTNLVLNGSIIMFSELAANYVVECVRLLLSTGRRGMEVRPDVFAAFNEQIDEANSSMAWGVPGVHNWYKNALGRVSQNWPLHALEYWLLTRKPSETDYEFRCP